MLPPIRYFQWWMTQSDEWWVLEYQVLWSWLSGNRLREVESVGGNQGESHLPTHCFLPSISLLLLSTSSISSSLCSFPTLSFDLPSTSSISVFHFSVCLWVDLFCHCIMPFAFYWVLQHFSTMFLILLLPSQCQSNLRPKGEWQSSNSRRTWGSRSCNCRRSTWRRSWCCLAHFPDFLPSPDEVELSTKITFNYQLWLQGWRWIQFPVN